jgi:mannose-6-phosphate isomerase-like protein (cupin superfamily)
MIHVYKEERPWGSFERFTKEVPSTVKIITVNQGEAISLQYHRHRQEFWRIIHGRPMVTIGEHEFSAGSGNEFFIDKHVRHRIAAPVNTVVFLEIAFGRFDEDDIVRLQDRYGRTAKHIHLKA